MTQKANCASPIGGIRGDELWRSRVGAGRFQRAVVATNHRLDRLGAVAEGHATSEWHDMVEPVPRRPLCRAAAACRAAWVHLGLAFGQQPDYPGRDALEGVRMLLVR